MSLATKAKRGHRSERLQVYRRPANAILKAMRPARPAWSGLPESVVWKHHILPASR